MKTFILLLCVFTSSAYAGICEEFEEIMKSAKTGFSSWKGSGLYGGDTMFESTYKLSSSNSCMIVGENFICEWGEVASLAAARKIYDNLVKTVPSCKSIFAKPGDIKTFPEKPFDPSKSSARQLEDTMVENYKAGVTILISLRERIDPATPKNIYEVGLSVSR
ncbi:MAG: hypothetical protein RR736_00595 [Pseudomonas sp.]|uniref:hypothetical protein n=1 Tax=Pseudomonas sp. TaxID=306 RepID=UPI002FCB479E